MIQKIELENFRCYKKHSINFSDLSIIVGKNNAGKSTLIEALRLISLVANRYKNLSYNNAPDWADLPKRSIGVSPSLKGIDISFKSIFYRYGNQPGKITAYFQRKSRIELLIGDNGKIFALLFDEVGNMILNKSQALNFNLNPINILPQIGPIDNEEGVKIEEYVKSNIYSSLSSLHFRNQLRYFPEYFIKFKNLSENNWENLKIREFDKGDQLYDVKPSLIISDDNFVTEVGMVGHGLQMWLQTMWFLARCDNKSTIILDEPDVYLHADMQRKLIKLLQNKFKQVIIATHSIEIISEVEPDNILVVNKNNSSSKFLTSVPSMQKVIDHLGSMQNLELIRYWTMRKILFIEGESKDDIKILRLIQGVTLNRGNITLDVIPVVSAGGWSGWQKVLGANTAIKNSGVKVYSIFDSDYHLEDEIQQRTAESLANHIILRIWGMKEIENFLIIPEVIFRFLSKKYKNQAITLEKIKEKINELADSMKDLVTDCYATEIQAHDKKLTVATVNQKARNLVNSFWGDHKIERIPGKKLISLLSQWSDEEFHAPFDKFDIAKEVGIKEISAEVRNLLLMIEK